MEISHRCDRIGDRRERLAYSGAGCPKSIALMPRRPKEKLHRLDFYYKYPITMRGRADSYRERRAAYFNHFCHGRAVIYVAGVAAYVLPLLTNPHYASEAKVIVKAEG